MTEFTPLISLLGGLLIGLAAVTLMAFHGRIAGINGIVSNLVMSPLDKEGIWRAGFVLGTLASPLVYRMLTHDWPPVSIPVSYTMIATGGFLVGLGTAMGSGCTSGHGVCGIARLSKRSIIATMTFMASGLCTVFIIRHVIGS